jgi:hypothetical protein
LAKSRGFAAANFLTPIYAVANACRAIASFPFTSLFAADTELSSSQSSQSHPIAQLHSIEIQTDMPTKTLPRPTTKGQ